MYGNPDFLFGANGNISYYFSEKGLTEFFKKFDLQLLIRSMMKPLETCQSFHSDDYPFNLIVITQNQLKNHILSC